MAAPSTTFPPLDTLASTGLFDYNPKTHQHDPWLLLMMGVYIGTTVLAFFLNAIVIGLIFRRPELYTISNMYIVHRALADVIFLSACPIWIISITQQTFVFGLPICLFVSAVMQIGALASVAFLTCFARDCYVFYVMESCQDRLRMLRSAERVVWVAGVIIGMIFALAFSEYMMQEPCWAHCVMAPLFADRWFGNGVIVLLMMMFPLISLSFYVNSVYHSDTDGAVIVAEILAGKEEKEIIAPPSKTLLVVLVSVTKACQLPFWISRVIATLVPNLIALEFYQQVVIFCLFEVSFILNPVLFLLLHKTE